MNDKGKKTVIISNTFTVNDSHSCFCFFASNSPNKGPSIAHKDFQHNRKPTKVGLLFFNL